MILVDTSVWISHFQQHNTGLESLLNKGMAATHPFIIGELACGNLKNRKEILTLMQALPSTTLVEDHEILHFIDEHQLMGSGLGLIDIHLLASAILSSIDLWTKDKILKQTATTLEISYRPKN